MEEVVLEQIIIYGTAIALCAITVYYYFAKQKRVSLETVKKVAIAKEEGLYEPVSLHPYIDLNVCIGVAACVKECPEKDIIGIVDGIATLINTSNCIGHGACFHACPVEAISLRIGTETRGVELPHVSENFETNTKGIYIAGELGGMGLIKNSVEQGQQAIDNIVRNKKPSKENVIDVVIIGAGPAGISATLAAKKHKLTSVTLEQDSLGGTVYTFPRSKIVMTAPMDLPLYGKAKLYDTSKDELLQLWKKVIAEHQLTIHEHTKVEKITPLKDETFNVVTAQGDEYICNNVLIAIGRRGSPRKLNVPGEDSEKVAYRLLEPEQISGKKIVVVGGGDSAVESAMLLKDQNEVILSYRKDKFSRIKPKNKEKIEEALSNKSLKAIFNSNLVSIEKDSILIKVAGEDQPKRLENDQIYIFAGGEMPTKFLQNAGIKIEKRYAHVVKKHN
ncbi:MAG TPA: 4Fe-4S dicluster domain-containing protein [Flavobacteriia bacterium]|nr:4Fe-4S dicluster domain-containing protein [Flavobacteriia bacterium]